MKQKFLGEKEQAQQIVQQVIGRGRRTPKDYCFALLCDYRYGQKQWNCKYEDMDWMHRYWDFNFSKLSMFFENEGDIVRFAEPTPYVPYKDMQPVIKKILLENQNQSNSLQNYNFNTGVSQEVYKMSYSIIKELIKKDITSIKEKKCNKKGKRRKHTCVQDIHGVCKKCKINESRRKPQIYCQKHSQQILNAKGTCWICQQNKRAVIKRRELKKKERSRSRNNHPFKNEKFSNKDCLLNEKQKFLFSQQNDFYKIVDKFLKNGIETYKVHFVINDKATMVERNSEQMHNSYPDTLERFEYLWSQWNTIFRDQISKKTILKSSKKLKKVQKMTPIKQKMIQRTQKSIFLTPIKQKRVKKAKKTILQTSIKKRSSKFRKKRSSKLRERSQQILPQRLFNPKKFQKKKKKNFIETENPFHKCNEEDEIEQRCPNCFSFDHKKDQCPMASSEYETESESDLQEYHQKECAHCPSHYHQSHECPNLVCCHCDGNHYSNKCHQPRKSILNEWATESKQYYPRKEKQE